MYKIKENNDFTFKLIVKKEDGTPQNITGWSFILTVKKKINDVTPILLKTSASIEEVIVTDASAGKVEIIFVPADTRGKGGSNFLFDIMAITDTGKQYTVLAPTVLTIENVLTD